MLAEKTLGLASVIQDQKSQQTFLRIFFGLPCPSPNKDNQLKISWQFNLQEISTDIYGLHF
jgi:hypothetical protein